MGLRVIQFQYEFNAIDCANCGMPFGVTPDFESRRRKDHRGFYCPHGHSNVYEAETDLEKERRKSQMLTEQVRMERLKAEQKLKRIHRGVCPECNRSFANVERHMKSKHVIK